MAKDDDLFDDFDDDEYDEMELLERLESLCEEMEDLHVTSIDDAKQRIAELHVLLDKSR